MKGIECAFTGRLGKDAQLRTSTLTAEERRAPENNLTHHQPQT